jgi:thermitase
MKREKIIFTFFIIPVFLFSASLMNWKLDRAKNKNSALSPQQIISLKKGQPVQPKRIDGELNQLSPKIKPDFPGQAEEASGEAYLSREAETVEFGRNRDLRSGRAKKPDRSLIRYQIKHLNNGLPYRYQGPPYRPNEVLVKFKPTLSEQTIKATIAAYQCKKIKRIPRIDVYKIEIQNNLSVEETLFALSRNPDVEYAEPNYIAHVTEAPDDPLFDLQYALYNPGSAPPGSPQEDTADIKATSAWEETKGDQEIIIAIIDTGVDLDHPDLDDKIYSSGYDFVNDDSDATDDHGHGTHVAGIAAAETNNAEGIAGVAWNCKILPVKILNDLGEGDYEEMTEGIIWAADNGADVINLSLGGDFPSASLENALKYAYDKDIVIVAAAGNEGGAVLYPAAYDDYCLAVAATNDNDERVTFQNTAMDLVPWESNFGPEIDVGAPGEEIVSTVPTWYFGPEFIPYGIGSGTSQATPHVAGLAALIKSIKPDLTAGQIMGVIRYSADDVNYVNNLGKDDYIGYGRINMDKALVPIKIKSSR